MCRPHGLLIWEWPWDDLNYTAGEYDHDGDPDTATLTGSFMCPDPSACSITVEGDEVQSITGYKFTSLANEVIVAKGVPVEDTSWLAFGVWLTETEGEGR